MNKFWDLAPPILIGMAIDVVTYKEDSMLADFGYPDPYDQFLILVALTVIIWVLESLFEYWFGVLWRNLAQNAQHELRMDAYEHIQNLEMQWFSGQTTGGLMAIMNDDVNQLERFLDQGANDLLQVATTVFVVGGVMFILAPSVAIYAILPIPIIVGGSFMFQRRIGVRYAKVRKEVGDLNALLNNNLSGITTIKSFTAEEREVERVGVASRSYRDANRDAIRLSASFVPLIRMAILFAFTANMLVGGWLALEGELSIGAYSIIVFITQRLLWPLTRLGQTFDLYQRAMASTDRVLNLLDTPIGLVEGDTELDETKGEISFNSIEFSYPERESVLDGVSLNIEAGETIGLVGSTGSGKTTLVGLLLRFHDPLQGSVSLDGNNVKELKLASLRGSISLVSQNTTLFPGTVRENILYGRPSASEEEVFEAARIAEATNFINELPEGWETDIGEDGHRLSGGQRQRLAIARAVLKDAPILVFDEATSNVDNETEAALQRSIERISTDRTTIIIAHRLSTVRNADKIAVLDSGKITELGKHEELVDADGLYSRLWSVQTGLAASDDWGWNMTDELSVPKLTKLAETIGFEITEFTPGKCIVELTIREDHLNAGGVAHGGLHATLLDTAMGGTLVTTLPKEEWCATAQLDLSYLEPAYVGSHLTAIGEVVRRGRNIAHLQGEITDQNGKKIAHARGTWAVWEKKPSSLV